MFFTYREGFRDRVQELTPVRVTFDVIGNGGAECVLRVLVGIAQKNSRFPSQL